MKRVVMFSSGAGSWAAARRVAAEHGTDGLTLLFTDVAGAGGNPHAGEDADNYRFLHEAAADIGGQLVVLNEGRDVWQVFRDQRFIGNTRVSNCSRTLKQEPARRWLDENCDPAVTTVYVGIDWTEPHRLPAMHRNYAPFVLDAPLTRSPYLDRRMLLDELRVRGIEPPRLYALGAEHSNCGGFCVRAGQGQFAWLLRTMPERYAYHEQQEQGMRDYLDADVSILRDRRGGVTRPLTLRTLRERIEAGRQPDLFDIGGCGCFTDDLGEAS